MSGWLWLVWLAGSLVGGLGGVFVAWGMLGDRLQGGPTRRRCPRCWHSLDGVPGLRCPECGHEAAAERRLFRSRRRWGMAMGGALLIALGAAAAATPMVSLVGWMTLLPDPARAVAWPWTTYERGGERLLKDAHEDRLGMMSRRLLVWRARQVLRSDAVWSMKGFALTLLATQGELAREARDEVLAMMSDAAPSNRGWAATVLACAGIDDDETRAALLVMVREDPHVEARYRAMDALRYLDPSAEIVPVLLEVFRAAERDVRGYAARELVKIGPEGIRPLSRELLVAHQRRREVIDALRNADAPNADAAVDAIAAALRSPEWEIRRDAAELAGGMPLGPDAAPVFTALVAALGDEHPDVLRAARRSLDTVDPVADPMLIEALTNPRPEIVEAVCTILPRRRPVPAAALPALAEVAADEGLPDSVREAARQAVARIEWLRERSAERE